MNELLKKLGFHDEVQAFFPVKQLRFLYGFEAEVFSEGRHFIPVSDTLWTGGAASPTQVIVSYSVMEIMAYLSLNRHAYPRLEELAFVSSGLLPCSRSFITLGQRYRPSKWSLIYPADVTGIAADIMVSGWLSGKSFAISWQKKEMAVRLREKEIIFQPEQFSLNRVQQAFGLRLGLRTQKSKSAPSYLMTLLYDHQ